MGGESEMMAVMSLWPPFDIRISTPELTLRLGQDPELAALAETACGNVVPEADAAFLGRWSQLPSPGFECGFISYHWGCRARLSLATWQLPFVVYPTGEATPVGVQELKAEHFGPIGRVRTGSWLLSRWQGRGIGTLMRAMVLEFAFRELGALDAITSSHPRNLASQRVCRRLGYRAIGEDIVLLDGIPARYPHFLLAREDWVSRPEITISGAAESLPMLGAPRLR